MDSVDRTWTEAAAAWVAEGRQERLPPTLTEALAVAPAVEIEQLLEQLVTVLYQLPPTESAGSSLDSSHLNDAEESDLEAETGSVSSQSTAIHHSPEALRLRSILQLIAARILRLRLENAEPTGEPIVDPDVLADLAAELAGISPAATAHCLQVLSAQGDAASLAVLCDFLKRQVIDDEHGVAIALSPLFQWPPADLASVFTMIGEEIWRWHLLGAMLDLAGHALRKRKLTQHPLSNQAPRLRELLSGTVGRLARLEENPQQFGDDVRTIQRVLTNAISLTVSLCDTLGLIGDQQAEGQLNQAMSLSHRRVQTEAAGALARLGKEHGKERLLQLAQDPAARLRALAYADELDIDDPQLAQWREPVAMAQAEVISWLADRERFGVPPAELEIVDERTLYWPSYEEPQPCFLFRFTYEFAQGDLSNLIIAGPMVYAFQADMRSLEIDDVYAVFAGWQAEHEDIYEVPAARFNAAQQGEASRLLDAPDHEGIEDLNPLALTFFFGERAVLASGTRDGQSVCTVSDGLETVTVPSDNRPTSLSPDLILALYRGRKLLRHFNS